MGVNNEELLKSIRYYQDSLDKYSSNGNNYKLLSVIKKLKKLPITTSHLENTGIGRTVNALRKLEGEVGDAAKALVTRWKEMVVREDVKKEETDNASPELNIDENEAVGNKPDEKENSYADTKHKEREKSSSHKSSDDGRNSEKEKSKSDKHSSSNRNTSHDKKDKDSKKHKHDRDNNSERHSSKSKHESETSESEEEKNESKSHSKKYRNESEDEDISSDEEKDSEKHSKSTSGRSYDKKDVEEYIPSKKHKHDNNNSTERHSSKRKHNSSSSESEEDDRKSRSKSHRSNSDEENTRSCDKQKKDVSKKDHGDREKSSKKHRNDRESSSKHHSSKRKHHSSSSSESEEEAYEKSYSKQRSDSDDDDEERGHTSKRESDDRRKHKSKSSKSDRHESKSKSKEKTEKSQDHSSSKPKSSRSESSSRKELDSDGGKSSSKHKKSSHDSDTEEKPRSKHEKESSGSKESKSHSAKHDKKDKTRDKEGSKDKHSHKKDEPKHESKEKSAKDDKEPKKEKTATSSPSKSKESGKSSKPKSSSEKNNKVKPVSTEKIKHGIDSESGASFAEALGMCGPMVYSKPSSSTKKKSTSLPTPEKPSRTSSSATSVKAEKPEVADEKYVPNLLRELPQQPLQINISSLLPEITPHYRPVSLPLDAPKRMLTQDEALSQAIYNKNIRTKVYSGNKVKGGEVESLFNICVKILQDNLDAIECTGGVPYIVLKTILEKATPDQLFNLEHYNPYLIEDTDELWRLHCMKEFRTKKREEMETWREMYMRCLDEREAKLNAITANIKESQDKSLPVRTTKLAYIDSIAKPPRNIAKKQAKNGIINRIPVKTSTSSKLSALATAGEAGKVSVPNPASRAVDRSSSSSSASAMKPKKAPLMAKTLSLFKNRFKR